MGRSVNILRKGLLLRRSGKKNLILATIDSKGTVDRDLAAELARMLGEIGYPAMAKTIKRHKNGLLVYAGITFALIRKPERLPTLLTKHGIAIKPEEIATVLGTTAAPRRGSRR